MTEAEWRTADDPDAMLVLLRDVATSRKLRLFCCACARRVWPQLAGSGAACRAVETAEAFADGECSEAERDAVLQEADDAVDSGNGFVEINARRAAAWSAEGEMDPLGTVRSAAWAAAYAAPDLTAPERLAQAELLRDIFGSPFRPAAFDPAWRTSVVVEIARGAYDERAFDRLPILADALQDAGCDCDELLSHLRDPAATHTRGCWALDLVLGKT